MAAAANPEQSAVGVPKAVYRAAWLTRVRAPCVSMRVHRPSPPWRARERCGRARAAACDWLCPRRALPHTDEGGVDAETLRRARLAPRRPHLRRCAATLLAGLLLWALLQRLVRRPQLTDLPDTFRAAAPVPPDDVARRTGPVFAEQLDRRLLALAQTLGRNGTCGVAAPNVRRFHAFAVLRLHGLWREVMNPRWQTTAASVAIGGWEHSLMCHDAEHGSRWVTRHDPILASFDTFLGPVEDALLRGRDARCFQHFDAVFRGEWPCANASLHPDDAARLPAWPEHWTE
jgi:hypothetical protein